jgi:hypothetical protein
MNHPRWLVWLAAVAMVFGALALALFRQPPKGNVLGGTGSFTRSTSGQSNGQDSPLDGSSAIVPKNAPVVLGFIGDLHNQGNPQDDGIIEPFVVGETLKLEVEALNAIEYRWLADGQVLKEKEQEWSPRPDRFFEVFKPGPVTFTVQVRGAESSLVSLPKTTTLTFPPLKIMKLAKSIIHDDDEHFLTGDTIFLEAQMASALGADPDYYRFRYFVNDSPIKHPDDDEEWSSNDVLPYVFATPGNYSFKVEARRTTEKQPEDTFELAETVVVADAVLASFDSRPDNEKGASIGTPVEFSSFPNSRAGKSECRFGIKKINVANYVWLTEENGAVWGDCSRTWVPTEPGTYLVRCEIRETGKEVADDFREMYFTVTDGNF